MTEREISERAGVCWSALPGHRVGDLVVIETAIRSAIADARAEVARGLRNLADGFHFAGDLPAEKTLRNWVEKTLAPAATTGEPSCDHTGIGLPGCHICDPRAKR